MSTRLLQILRAPLDPDVGQRFARATEAMWRDLDYLDGKQSGTSVHLAVHAGWPLARLKAIAAMNSFYRLVLSPMGVATMTTTTVGVGQTVRIDYGSIRLDSELAAPLRAAVENFLAVAKELGVQARWLSAASAGDLAYFVGHADDESWPEQ